MHIIQMFTTTTTTTAATATATATTTKAATATATTTTATRVQDNGNKLFTCLLTSKDPRAGVLVF